LDLLFKAMATESIKSSGIYLMIVGEFYEDATPYYELINTLDIKDRVNIVEGFIADKEVRNYVCSADFIIQPYRNATQSGVISPCLSF
jgi:hypothetical protein